MSERWSSPATLAIARFCSQHMGLSIRGGGIQNREAAMARAMRRAGVADPARYLELLPHDPVAAGRRLGTPVQRWSMACRAMPSRKAPLRCRCPWSGYPAGCQGG